MISLLPELLTNKITKRLPSNSPLILLRFWGAARASGFIFKGSIDLREETEAAPGATEVAVI